MTTNPKKGLLMYVIEKIEESSKNDAINQNEDLSEYELASKIPISQLQTDFGEIKKGVK